MSANSALAQSVPNQTYQTTLVNKLLGGNARQNIVLASVFAGIYGILMFGAVFNFIREKHRSHLLLVLFGAIRVVAFSVRAYMQHHLTENLAIVYEVFYSVGFVALVKLVISLLMAWTLPDARDASRQRANKSRRPSLLRSHGSIQERVAVLALIVGAVCSIIGATDVYDGSATLSTYNKGLKLMRAGYTIYLAVIAGFVIMCLIQPFFLFSSKGTVTGVNRSYSKNFFMASILLVCGLLLTCKSVFQVYAIYTDPSRVYENKLFYPLEVATEVLTVFILTIPGVIHMYLSHHAQVPLNNNIAYEQGKASAADVPTTTPTGTATAV